MIAVVATPVLAFPYVLLDRAASRIDVQTDAAWLLLVVHVPCAAVAMILGALQFVPRVRAIRRRHRIIGRTVLGLGTVAFALTGIPLAITTPHGNLTRFAVLVPAAVTASIPYGQWIGWILNLALAEWIVRRLRRSESPV